MIFFDLDGTLLDHKYSEYLGVSAFYQKYKGYLKLENETFYKLWRQVSDRHFSRYLNGEITFNEQRIGRIKELFIFSDINLSDKSAENIFNDYLKIYERNWKPFSDVIPCLQQLNSYKLGVISNGDLEQQSLKLERMGIKKYFSTIVTAGEFGIAKPNVKLFDIACRRVNEYPENCYYIGDDIKMDIMSCMEIGMRGIWLNRNNENVEFDDIKVISSLDDLKSIL